MSMRRNKSLLFIFDSRVNINKAVSLISRYGVKQVDLFPLTGDPTILQEIEAGLCKGGCDGFFKYETSVIIDEQVALLRDKICKWSAGISEIKVGRKKVREWFILPGCNISYWWFSLLADKSPFKTDAFLRIAQVHAVDCALKRKEYGFILLVTGSKDFRKAIKKVAGKSSLPMILAPLIRSDGLKVYIRKSVKNSGLFTQVIRGAKYFFDFLGRKYLVVSRLPLNEKRFHDSRSILFVSYFPLLEKESAQNGIFRNRFALALQDKLREAGVPITWILMYVPIDGFSFKEAVCVANRFAAKGERLLFLEEFLSLKDALCGLFLWVREIFIGLFLFRPANKGLIADPVGAECMSFVKSLWSESFYGPLGLGGILFTLAFRRMFKTIRNVNDCLYYFEMQPWEHALNSAKSQVQPNIRSIGFQHSSIPKNLFNYFYDRSVTLRTGSQVDLPLPDIIACNGQISQDLLAQSGYPALIRLESLRYLYLDKILTSPINKSGKRRLLLVAGTGDRDESLRLILLIRSAFPKAQNFDICFKGHPCFPFDKLFKELGIDASESGYIVDPVDISASLKEAFAVVTLSNTLMIESLAFGCEVIVPFFPDVLSLNTLIGFEKYYHKTTNKEELANVVAKISSGYSLCDIHEYRNFVRKYWDIDNDIPQWLNLLNVGISAKSDNTKKGNDTRLSAVVN